MRMVPKTVVEFESRMTDLIADRNGVDAATLLLTDPLKRFANAFNNMMKTVQGDDIEATYSKPVETLARPIDACDIATFPHCIDMMYRVLWMTGRHYCAKSRRIDNPRVPLVRKRGCNDQAGERLSLFVKLESDLGRFPGGFPGSSYELERSDLLRVMLAEGRWLGPLRLRVTPEDCLAGKILVIDLPVKEFAEVGQFAAIIWKYLFQRAVERRVVAVNPRPCFLFVDESQIFYDILRCDVPDDGTIGALLHGVFDSESE